MARQKRYWLRVIGDKPVEYHWGFNMKVSREEHGGPAGYLKPGQIIYYITKTGAVYRFSFKEDLSGETFYIRTTDVEIVEGTDI